MSLESDVRDLLSPHVEDRVFPDVAPAGTATPYATFQQVGGTALTFLEPVPVGKKNARVQVNVWTRGRIEANTKARSIEDAFVSAGHEPMLAQISLYEPDTRLYGTQQDFSVWYDD